MPKTFCKLSNKRFLEKNNPEKLWFDKGTEYEANFKNFALKKALKFTRPGVKQKLHLQREPFND